MNIRVKKKLLGVHVRKTWEKTRRRGKTSQSMNVEFSIFCRMPSQKYAERVGGEIHGMCPITKKEIDDQVHV